MSEKPPLTILIGPQTRVALALNDVARDYRWQLADAGLASMPSRLASPLIRRSLDHRPLSERIHDFEVETANRPVFLSAVNFFGHPHDGLVKGEMFPDAERSFAGLKDIAPKARYIISIDTLPAFFLGTSSEPLETQVRRTPWEMLYELNWTDLVREFKAALPASELIVLTPEGACCRPKETLLQVFGSAADALPDHYGLLAASISETGRAVLTRISAEGDPSQETLGELYGSFALRPTAADTEQRLGIDKVTAALLKQRFEEDIVTLRKLPGTQVI